MKKERRKIVITGVIIILVIASLIIGLVGNKLYVNNKIRDSNINTYQFLKCITSCDTIYNIDFSDLFLYNTVCLSILLNILSYG